MDGPTLLDFHRLVVGGHGGHPVAAFEGDVHLGGFGKHQGTHVQVMRGDRRDDEDLGTINAAAIRREIKLFYIISLSPKLIEFGGWKGRVWSLKRVSLRP